MKTRVDGAVTFLIIGSVLVTYTWQPAVQEEGEYFGGKMINLKICDFALTPVCVLCRPWSNAALKQTFTPKNTQWKIFFYFLFVIFILNP